MAFSDWAVEVFDVVPRRNSQKNPLTGLPIDPDGITLSLVTMRLTHVPTGKVLQRADLMRPDRPSLIAYARGIAENAEAHMAAQKTDTAPSPLAGRLDIVPVPPGDPPQRAKDLQAFLDASGRYEHVSTLAAQLRQAAPARAAELDAKVQSLKTARDSRADKAVDALLGE